MNIVLTLQNNIPVFNEMLSSSSSLQKCTKHTSINTLLLPDGNIYGINTVKQLLVSPCLLILVNITLRILIADKGKTVTFLVNFDIFMSK